MSFYRSYFEGSELLKGPMTSKYKCIPVGVQSCIHLICWYVNIWICFIVFLIFFKYLFFKLAKLPPPPKKKKPLQISFPLWHHLSVINELTWESGMYLCRSRTPVTIRNTIATYNLLCQTCQNMSCMQDCTPTGIHLYFDFMGPLNSRTSGALHHNRGHKAGP